MRMTAVVVGVVLSLLLVAPAARASDETLRSTAKRELTKLQKAEARFERAVEKLDNNDLSAAEREVQKLSRAVSSAHGRIEDERADSSKLKRARTKLLDALSTYEKGLDALAEALDDNSQSKAQSALKKIRTAAQKFRSAGRAFS